MLRIAFILVSTWAVFAQKLEPHVLPKALRLYPYHDWHRQKIVTEYPTVQDHDYEHEQVSDWSHIKDPILPDPSYDEWLSYHKRPASTPWKDRHGHFPASLPLDPKLWKPPPYFESLKEIDDATLNIKNHFTVDKLTPRNDPRYRYISVVHVLEGLTKEVAQNGWETYNKNYDALIINLLNKIAKKPQETMAEMNCVFEASKKKIQRMRSLITNQWVEYLCKAQPLVCDTLVFAIVKMSEDKELNEEAELLLLLGEAASNYLDIYARVFEAVLSQNVYMFLKTSKESLRTLVYKNSLARRQASQSLDNHCFVPDSPIAEYF